MYYIRTYFPHCAEHKRKSLNIITVVCAKLCYKILSLIHVFRGKMRFFNVRIDETYI